MRGFVVACWVVLALLGSARAEEPATTSTSAAPTAPAAPAAAAPVVQETTVRGTPPDLAGRWLAVTWIELGQDTVRNVATPWDITERDGRLQLTVLFVELAVVKEAIDKANADRVAWRPTREELARVLASWDQLPPVEPHLARVRHEISARDGFADEVKAEPRTKDAIWVVSQRHDADPSGAPLIRQAMVYAALAATDGDYTGNYDGVSLAAAPFPIPISLKGTFRLYRLTGEPKPRGLLVRLLDMLAGCGARAK